MSTQILNNDVSPLLITVAKSLFGVKSFARSPVVGKAKSSSSKPIACQIDNSLYCIHLLNLSITVSSECGQALLLTENSWVSQWG